MDEYLYIYKDLTETWRPATNPVFIAKHTHCRAIPKHEINKHGFETYSDFIYELNTQPVGSIKCVDLIQQWDLY